MSNKLALSIGGIGLSAFFSVVWSASTLHNGVGSVAAFMGSVAMAIIFAGLVVFMEGIP